jgi:phage/plasmid-like protein (TIGR03299 family)
METTNSMSFTEALAHYRIDFDMETFPLGYLDQTGHFTKLDGVNGMRRADTLKPLDGVSVGRRYNVIQTSSYADIGDRIVRGANAEFVKGGLMKGGNVAYLQAKFPDSIRVKGTNDAIDKYLTFVNSFDGSSPFYILPTLIRIFCTNQFAALSRDAKANGLKIRHTRSADERIQQADEALLELMDAYRTVEIKVNALADTKFSDKMMDAAVRKLFGVKPDLKDEDVATRTLNNMNKVRELFEAGVGLEGWRGTAWAAFNAVTEFADHHRSLRSSTDPFEANLIGSGALLKDKGLKVINQVISEAA